VASPFSLACWSGRKGSVLEQVVATARILPEPKLVDGFVEGRVSVIMPAYDEANYIAEGITSMKSQFEAIRKDYEIIVVDDGSTDATREIAEELTDGRVRVVSYKRNQGKGHALREGLLGATGQFVFLIDSDAEIVPQELWAYIRALESADIVIGSKRHPLSTVRTPIVRKILSLGFNVLERLLTGIRVSDTQAGLKAARSAALYGILPLLSVKRYAFDAELLTVASLLNLRIKELPVHIELRATFSARHVFRMLIDLLGIMYRLRVKRWYQKNMVEMSETYKPIIHW
jgi:glycosyltransferase involved in cell wall biosynthesis